MKKYLLFLLLIIIASGVHSQPSIKVFAFEQESSPGTVAVNLKGENGNPIKKAATRKNYFIYLSLKQNYDIIPQQMFIEGKAFFIETGIIEATPVQYIDNNIPGKPQHTILVPKTSDKVIRLKIVDPVAVEKTSTLQKLTKKNDVVISYSWKKKKYFAVLKKLKKLEPVLNE